MARKGFTMKTNNSVSLFMILGCLALVGCAGTNTQPRNVEYDTPTVDYVERLNVNDAPNKDSFLNQLAMNYRSYAIYNARTSGYPEIGELFAQKAIGAFSGEKPFPENLNSWEIESEEDRFEIYNAYNELMEILKSDAIDSQPRLVAESQAKFDCWMSATASGQEATAQECKKRFYNTYQALKECLEGKVPAVATQVKPEAVAENKPKPEEEYYPETYRLSAMSGTTRNREGVIIVNNINIPSNLVQTVPVPQVIAQPQQPQTPMVFNQNIYSLDESSRSVTTTPRDCGCKNGIIIKEVIVKDEDGEDRVEKVEAPCNCPKAEPVVEPEPEPEVVEEKEEIPEVDKEYVSREEFINLMMAMRSDLLAINKRLDELDIKQPAPSNEKTVIKVQQIPLEPKQHIMEEIFEVRFDFNKSVIKPEYEEIIRKLAATTQENKNVKVSVVGHTDTAGSNSYNYALGGRRAEAVQKMLIEYGIPSSQIIAVSAGEEDLKVQTPNNTPNAENRRVRVVKEIHFEEPAKPVPIVVEEYKEDSDCEDCAED